MTSGLRKYWKLFCIFLNDSVLFKVTRKIIHIDMDAFYASIEQRDNPELRGKPVVVGGRPEKRGVVAAASYEARKFGIHSAMPMSRAVSVCRDLVIVNPDFGKYGFVSRQLYSMYKEYTDLIEPVALDEAYLDVTENKRHLPVATEIALFLKKRIKRELGLTASAGVAPNKLLAKIASEEKKPDGLFVIKPHQIESFMKDLDLERIWGVGKVTGAKLKRMGLVTCGDIQKYDMESLGRILGKFGKALYFFIRGIDNRPVVTHREAKSIGAEITFAFDYSDMAEIRKALLSQVERVHSRLQKAGSRGKTITIKVKYSDFTQITRSCTIDRLTDSKDEIYSIAEKLLINKTEAGKRRVRLIGASVSNFEKEEEPEEGLFAGEQL
jgi:DNA polymerase IV